MPPGILDWLRRLMFWRRKKPAKKIKRKLPRPKKRKIKIVRKPRKVKRIKKRKPVRVKRKKLIRVRKRVFKPKIKVRRIRFRRKRIKPQKIKEVAKTYGMPEASLQEIYSKLSELEKKLPTKPTELGEVEALKEKVESLEETATKKEVTIVPEIMDWIDETKTKIYELEKGLKEEKPDPVTELKNKINSLEKEKEQIKKAEEVIKNRYYRREIDEASFKKIMENYEQKIIEADIKIKDAKKELEKVQREVARIRIPKVLEEPLKIPKEKPAKPVPVEVPKLKFREWIKPKISFPRIFEKPVKERIPKKLKEVIKEAIVADVMTKNVLCVNASDTLSYTVRLFADKKISGAPVLKGNNFVGVISESDILKVIGVRDLLSVNSLGLKRLKEIKIEQVMHKNPLSVYENTKLSDAADLMNKYDIARLPVLDEKRDIVGILTRSDIIRGVSKELLFRILKRRPEEEVWLRKIETDIDEILRIVDRRGSIGVGEIQQKLMIPEDKIEEWGKILEKHNLLEMYYPPIGKPEFRKKPVTI